MKYFPVFLALLSIAVVLADTRKGLAATASQTHQTIPAEKKTSAKKSKTTEVSELPQTKKQPSSAAQPLLIDRIYEQQKMMDVQRPQ